MSLEPTGKKTDGPISKYLNRKISLRITRLILKYGIGISPTQVSVISFLIAIFSAIVYLYEIVILAGIMVQIASIIDGVDGELARARNLVSRKGGFIDSVLDRIANIAVYLSISILLIRFYDVDLVLTSSLLALSGDLLVTYLHAVSQKDLGLHPALVGRVPSIASRDVRLFIIFLASLLTLYKMDFLLYSMYLLGLLCYFYVIVKFVELIMAVD